MSAVREAIKSKLAADSELGDLATGIYFKLAPAGAQLPYVIFQKQSGLATWAMGGPAWDWDLWLIKGVGPAERAEDIDLRCQDILNRTTLMITGRIHQALFRMSDMDYVEDVKGERVDHVGSIYRLVSEPSS